MLAPEGTPLQQLTRHLHIFVLQLHGSDHIIKLTCILFAKSVAVLHSNIAHRLLRLTVLDHDVLCLDRTLGTLCLCGSLDSEPIVFRLGEDQIQTLIFFHLRQPRRRPRGVAISRRLPPLKARNAHLLSSEAELRHLVKVYLIKCIQGLSKERILDLFWFVVQFE